MAQLNRQLESRLKVELTGKSENGCQVYTKPYHIEAELREQIRGSKIIIENLKLKKHT